VITIAWRGMPTRPTQGLRRRHSPSLQLRSTGPILTALSPRSGALVHMSHASHGEGLGRIWCWLLFLAYVPVPAVETEAIVTYANNYLPYVIQPGSESTAMIAGMIGPEQPA